MSLNYNALLTDLMSDLTECVGEGRWKTDDSHYPGITLQECRAQSLSGSFFKKLKDKTSPEADHIALGKFLQANQHCKNWDLDVDGLSSWEELMLGQFRNELYHTVTHQGHSILDSYNQILRFGRTGPGASILARGGDFYTKLFDSKLSTTSSGLYAAYAHYTESDPIWNDAERQRLSKYGDPVVVSGNRLSFVPKNDSVSRVIATEPNLNMFLQLGVGEIINHALKRRYGIDMSDQQIKNRELARLGSVTGDLSTIDLSSASDTVAHSMLRVFLPADFLIWLESLRSPNTTLPDGSVVPLHMISSMGNGYTFSLETLVFTCAVAAIYRINDKKMRKTTCSILRKKGQTSSQEVWEHGNFGVFGDDIIVESDVYLQVTHLLGLLGFTVNNSKSFFEGPFRESCGGDFFEGHPVRGIYVKSLKTQASRYVAINRLNEWTAMTDIPLKRTIRRLIKSVRYLPVPLHENDDAGVKVPLELIKGKLCDPQDPSIGYDNNKSILYRFWRASPNKISIKESFIRTPRSLKKRCYNSSGLMLAFLQGCIEDSTITVRSRNTRYCSKQALSPHWDYVPTVGKQFPIGPGRLANAIKTNLN